MLRKPTELEIDPKEPFKNDCLDRKKSADILSALVKTITQPFVLSVTGPWGTGKTTFIRMWMEQLKADGHPCFYFNAWENDFVDDPIVPLLGEFQEYIESHAVESKEAKAAITKNWNRVKKIGGGMLRRFGPLAIKAATQGLVDADSVKEAIGDLSGVKGDLGKLAEKLAEERLASYSAEKDAIAEFKKGLSLLVELISKNPQGRRGPVMLLIDEMDRCRPLFAVQLLERIKHLFAIPGVVFVLGIDREQIIHSIQCIYGIGMDGEGYLRRFIDLEYRLPKPSIERFAHFLYNKLEMDDVLKIRKTREGDEGGQLLRGVSFAADVFGFSLRVLEQCFTQLNMILRTTPDNYYLFIPFLIFLLSLKTYRPALYRKLCDKEINGEEVIEALRKTPAGTKYLDEDRNGGVIEAYLIRTTHEENELSSIMARMADSAKQLAENSRERRHAEHILHVLQQMGRDFDTISTGTLRYLVGKIEMLEHFQFAKQ